MRDCIVKEVMPGSPESLEGCNSMNICLNGVSEESINSYTKSRCHWSGCLIKIKLKQGRYGRLNPQGPQELH